MKLFMIFIMTLFISSFASADYDFENVYVVLEFEQRDAVRVQVFIHLGVDFFVQGLDHSLRFPQQHHLIFFLLLVHSLY